MKKCLISLFIGLFLIALSVNLTPSTSAYAEGFSDGVSIYSTGTGALRYGYTMLSQKERHVYDRLVSGVMNASPLSRIEFDKSRQVDSASLTRAINIFRSDYPECFWMGNHYNMITSGEDVVAIEPTYAFTGNALTQAKGSVNDAVNNILNTVEDGSNYEVALQLHDALAWHVSYEAVGEHQTVYGALVDKKAVCAGYASSYQLLLQCAGIDALTVTGWAGDVAHAWNLVWIDDGVCVYTDVTWNDQVDDTFHYYFNMTRAQIEADHDTDTSIFTLPECTHTGHGYFDKTGAVLTDSTTPAQAFEFFETNTEGYRYGEFLYTGTDLSAWINTNIYKLCVLLGGTPTSYSPRQVGKEIHLVIEGNFPVLTYKVSLTLGNGLKCFEEISQNVLVGEAITKITVMTESGYYLPEGYSVEAKNGITVTRDGYNSLVIEGTPTANTDISLPSATTMQKLAAPTAVFNADGESTGTVSGIIGTVRYSTDGGSTWQDGEGESFSVSGITEAHGLRLFYPGNGCTTLDSDVQLISIEGGQLNEKPFVGFNADGTGRIYNLGSGLQYRAEGGEWIDCEGEISPLEGGEYYLRVAPSGTLLASEQGEKIIVAADGEARVSGVRVAESITLTVGQTQNIAIEILPADAVNKVVYCEISGTKCSLASPNSAVITALERGEVTLKVTTQEGAFVAECVVSVICHHQNKTAGQVTLPACRGGQTVSFNVCDTCGQYFAEDGVTEIEPPSTEHIYGEELEFDGTGHWNECACGEKANHSDHTYGEWQQTEDGDGNKIKIRTCAACGYEQSQPVAFNINDIIRAVRDFCIENKTPLIIGCVVLVASMIVLSIIGKRAKKRRRR